MITATLDDLPDAIARAGVGAPAVLVIGDVVRLRSRLARNIGGTAEVGAQRCSVQTV